jgi:hypothetical protein
MTSRNIIARVIAAIYLLLGCSGACVLVYLLLGGLWVKELSILFIILPPSIVIAIIMIIVYRIFFKYSVASLTSLSGLIGVSAFYVANIALKHLFSINLNRAIELKSLFADLGPILFGYLIYRFSKFYFMQDFKPTLSKNQNHDTV